MCLPFGIADCTVIAELAVVPAVLAAELAVVVPDPGMPGCCMNTGADPGLTCDIASCWPGPDASM